MNNLVVQSFQNLGPSIVSVNTISPTGSRALTASEIAYDVVCINPSSGGYSLSMPAGVQGQMVRLVNINTNTGATPITISNANSTIGETSVGLVNWSQSSSGVMSALLIYIGSIWQQV